MCTALSCKNGDFYFGRTLDDGIAYGNQVVITPRNYPLRFCFGDSAESHFAIIGMACVAEGYPLYFEGVNEMGLAVAGLRFAGYAQYGKLVSAMDNVAQYELIPWLLSRCANAEEAEGKFRNLNITDTAFCQTMPPAPLHWLVADRERSLVLECVKDGVQIYPNPTGVLTNNPPFDQQMLHLNDYLHLSALPQENRFSPELVPNRYSLGMGALGLPGDWSSRSRFVRAAFAKMNSVCGASERERVSQFFHILDTVSQVRGTCLLENGAYEITQYTSCCNADRGLYYYTTYENRQITAVDLFREDLNGTEPSASRNAEF